MQQSSSTLQIIRREWNYTYNNFGQVLTATDPLGKTTTNTYDVKGNLLTSITDPRSMCRDRAKLRNDACLAGLPDPGPLDPLDPNWSID